MPNLTVSADIDALMAAANDAAARGELGGTTVGQSLFLVANPSAITFIRVNADNTVTLLSAGDFLTAIGAINGSALNAGNLNAGTVPDARFPATLPAASGANLTNLAIANLVAGVLAGNMTLGEEAGQLVLDPALSVDGKWSGIMEAGTSGGSIVFGNVVYFDAGTSRWKLADATAAATAELVKIAMCVSASVGDGDPMNVLLWGKIRADAVFPALTIGAAVYISETAGEVVTTAPTTTDSVSRIIGFGNTANELMFQPSPDSYTHV